MVSRRKPRRGVGKLPLPVKRNAGGDMIPALLMWAFIALCWFSTHSG